WCRPPAAGMAGPAVMADVAGILFPMRLVAGTRPATTQAHSCDEKAPPRPLAKGEAIVNFTYYH
ncbi:MAG: hypothetical protein SPE56_01805, partial [Prevotella sp.]|nr:hypothetical protein [Prevotella sp.]